MEYAVTCSSITIEYPLGFLGRTAQLFGYDSPDDSYVALEDVSFKIEKGDRLGIIGLNGAGKTTLLRCLAGALKPKKGSIETNGRVQSLLSSSSGTIGERSGLENIYLRGLALGMSRAAITEQIDDIVEFAELDDFIYQPLRNYSSGMSLRLMFGVSTAFPPDILIMDEWIGVGDKQFQERALNRMDEFVHNSGTLVLASHSKGIITRQCNKGLLLQEGRVIAYGDIQEVYDYYEKHA